MSKRKLQTFGERLRDARVAKGYSLRKFAKEADVSPTYLSQVEQDKVAPPTADRVKRIAELLGESVDEWMAYADRLDEELPDIIHSDPAVPDLLRAVQGMTPEQLKKVRAAADKIRESGEKYQ
jgi:transcriptional regulator with XRE-family HTH domain